MKYEVYVPSTKQLKVTAAKEAVIERFNAHPSDVNLNYVTIHSLSLPEDGKRPKMPTAIFGYRGIRKAAHVRVWQMEQEIGSYIPKDNQTELIVAQESGLKINNPFKWCTRGITSEATVVVVKDRRSGKKTSGVSKGVAVKLRDVRAILNDDLRVWNGVIAKTLTQQGRKEVVDDIDWYQQYDFNNPTRAFCVTQATRRAMKKI